MRIRPSTSERRAQWIRTLAGVIAWFLAALPAVALAQTGPGAGASTAVMATEPVSVAIASFENISANPADDWIGAGIAETLSAEFARLDTVSVVGRQPVAKWLVTGAYQRVGDRMRITARVTDTETGAVASAARADGSVGELFALQDQIAADLSTTLRVRINGGNATPVDSSLPRLVSGNGNGNGSGGTVPPRRSARRAPMPPADVAGSLELGARAEPASNGPPAAGFAAAAGILTGRPMLRPTRTDTRPDIDGRLDDEVWRNAVRITEFVQEQPLEGAPATEETEAWISYDSQNLYVAFHAHYEDPGIMRATRVDRDRAFRDDKITVYFDPFLDQQRAYAFSVNGYNVQGDEIINARGGGGGGRGGRGGGGGGFRRSGIPWGDDSWDVLFDSGAQIVDDGFTAEMAIPFKSLRYPRRERDVPHRWAFQIVREIRDKDENVVWAPISRGVAGFLPQMGLLEGMTNLSTSRNLEIMPVATGLQLGSIDTSTGAFQPGDAEPEGGVNVKYGITSNLTLDFTFNPDFSQVESDRPQIEINQRFALFYPELRPFFLEGAEIFNVFGPVNFVHTRTIRDPDWGAKITGKVGRTSIGFLAANDAAAGAVAGLAGPAADVGANVLIGRARYDLYSESHIGAMVTNRDFLGGYSRMVLADGAFRLGQTQAVAFTAVQTDNRDLDGIDSRGTLFDVNYRLNGRNWSIFNGTYTLSPDFQTDVGFVQRTDQRRNVTTVGYRFWPESWLINWGPSVTYGRNWNFDDVLEDEQFRASLNTTFANNISASVSANRDMERYLGVNFDKVSYRAFGRVSTSSRFSIGGFYQYGDEVRYQENPFLGHGGSGGMFLTLRPVPRFQSQININSSRLFDPRIDPRNDDPLIFDVTIVRALSTYQFTDRLALRNIAEFNTLQKTAGLNLLVSYRVNAGTVFYVGYDDRYRQGSLIVGDDIDGDGIQDYLFPSVTTLQRTNRAFFTKFQYLFRY
ncbi:MAG: hypothetical protein F4W89_11550 [Acidobacteria bacterium]|nr:hypothetical protein [Acidobacteriota bacterium]